MVARIHYRESGVEYVLQYNSTTDTIELRRNHFRLIGGIPNYFRDATLGNAYEIQVFKRILLNARPNATLVQSVEEKALIHEFEKIAGIYLCLTHESCRNYRMALMAEMARAMQGLDLQPLVSAINRLRDSLLENFVVSPDMLAFPSRFADSSDVHRQELGSESFNPPDPPPSTEPPIAQEISLRNTEGMTEEEIQDNLEFIARLERGESIPATEFPLRDRNRDEAPVDELLREIDEVLEAPDSDDDTVRAAPSHHPGIPSEIMSKLWKQARDED